MMADKQLIDQAAHIDLTRCYAKLDRFIEERKRRRVAVEKAAIRAGDEPTTLPSAYRRQMFMRVQSRGLLRSMVRSLPVAAVIADLDRS